MTETAVRDSFLARLSAIIRPGAVVDDAMVEGLEELLISADLGVHVTDAIIGEVREQYRGRPIGSEEELHRIIKAHMVQALAGGETEFRRAAAGPTVILFVGVNGTGKTTSIGKLAHRYIGEGKKVLLGAGDTFRAAAGEQLGQWAKRTGADIVSHGEGGDPAAVIFDAVEAGIARGADYILLDTAGRLHTKQDLMKQLEKITRVIKKKVPDGPHEVVLVMDATAGQNGLAQARQFYQDAGVTGIFLAKMDGTAKGGIVFAIKRDLNIPVKLIGMGEQAADLRPFDPAAFVDRIFFGHGDAAPVEAAIARGLTETMTPRAEPVRRRRTGLTIAIVVAVLAVLGLLAFVFRDIWIAFFGDLLDMVHFSDWFA
ncbi:MAG: signal recognition particle-docking protein FtsY [Planctomycetota bacterium]